MKKEEKGLAVIAPCYNEEENIRRLVDRVEAALADFRGDFELILVDDASRDNTWEEISRAAKEKPWVRALRHEKNRGLVEGWRTGLSATRAERVVTIDADLQYRPEDIPRLIAAMEENGADMAQGWRRRQVERGVLRYALTWGWSLALNLMFGMRLKDIKSGFVCYTRQALADVLDFRGPYRYFQHFNAIAAGSLGYSIVEVPVVFDRREAGESFISSPLRFSLLALGDIPRALWEFRVVRRRKAGSE